MAPVHVLSWPKTRRLTDASGDGWRAVLSPGLLTLVRDDGGPGVTFTDTDQLRAFAMQVYAAAIDHDGAVQEAAVKASLERRRARGLGGHRHGPFTDVPEPPLHMEVPA
jgi:hypothetical protein